MIKTDKKNIADILALTPLQEGMLFHYLRAPRHAWREPHHVGRDAHHTETESNQVEAESHHIETAHINRAAAGGTRYYMEQLSLTIRGEIRRDIFEKSWGVVAEANEMLRTFFRWEKMDKPIQIILKHFHPEPVYYNLSALPEEDKKRRLEELKENDLETPFDLRTVPFRLILCQLEEHRFEMIISNHHILYDGWSNGIILKEFFETYNCLRSQETGGPAKITGTEVAQSDSVGHISRGAIEKKTPFKEFIKWFRVNYKKEYKGRELFWKRYLENFEPQDDLAAVMGENVNKRLPGGEGSRRVACDNAGTLENGLNEAAGQLNITTAALLYYAWGLLLHLYCNRDDVVLGTTVSGRTAKVTGIENMVGLFINTLPLRIGHACGDTVENQAKKIDAHLKAREAYAHTPLTDIGSICGDRAEFFDTIVVIENYPLDTGAMRQAGGPVVESFAMVESSHYDITVSITFAGRLEISLMYGDGVFSRGAVEQLARHFGAVLAQVAEAPAMAVERVQLLSDAEKTELLVDMNRTEADFPQTKTIHRLFEDQVIRTPGNTALISATQVAEHEGERTTRSSRPDALQTNAFGSADPGPRDRVWPPETMTYAELNRRCNALAAELRERGVLPGDVVGILVERSFEMVIGVLAVLKAEAAYMPVSPRFPAGRVRYMLADSCAALLLTTGLLAEEIGFERLLRLDGPLGPGSEGDDVAVARHLPMETAYIIYTSGSTGKPKGVAVRHESAVNILSALQRLYPFLERDTYLLKTSF
ncbi:MAG: AMP-binding protein, partial [bacterium]|nr:AMP-binding protein [bacterium]